METYEKQRVEEIAAAIANATALERSGQCAAAAELLSRIPESRRSLPVQQAIARCRELAGRRASLLGSLDTKDESSLRAAITEARDYLHRLNDAGIKDNAFVEELEEAESLASSFKRSRSVPVFATRVFDWPSEAFAWCADVITDTTSDPRVIILIVALVFFVWFYLNFGVGDQ